MKISNMEPQINDKVGWVTEDFYGFLALLKNRSTVQIQGTRQGHFLPLICPIVGGSRFDRMPGIGLTADLIEWHRK